MKTWKSAHINHPEIPILPDSLQSTELVPEVSELEELSLWMKGWNQAPKLSSSQNQVDQILKGFWKSSDDSFLASKLRKLNDLSEWATKYVKNQYWELEPVDDNKTQLDATKLLIDLATGKHLQKKWPLIDNSRNNIGFIPNSRQ